MSTELAKRWPWEPIPVAETVTALQSDLAYMTVHTAILVHSNRPGLRIVVNTRRGQIVPRGIVRFADGSTVEFQDIGMPQPGSELLTVPELVDRIWQLARSLGLELAL